MRGTRVKLLKKEKSLGVHRKWVAMGTLAACAASGAGQAVVLAQQAGSQPGGASASQTLPVVRFKIDSGNLADALAQFERASGWKVVVPDHRMETLPTQGVSGMLPVNQALRQILSGTGLGYRMTGTTQAVLEFEQSRSSIEVSERAPLASPRYTEPLRDLPQTITVIPKDVIAQQGATSLTDVLRNVPGLTITAGEGGTPAGDNLTLRGNSARNDIFVDGVRDLNPQTRDPFNLEQVEVTKGPTSAVSGRGSAGGPSTLSARIRE